MSQEPTCRVLIAEDDDDLRLALAAIFAQDDFEVSQALDGEDLLDYLEVCRQQDCLPDLLVLDHKMPSHCGLDVLRTLRRSGSSFPVIVITAFGDEVGQAARQLGACAVFDKPFEADDLRTAVYYWTGRGDRARGQRAEASPLEESPTCAACGSSRRIRVDPRLRNLYLCAECRDRAGAPEDHEDLGVGD